MREEILGAAPTGQPRHRPHEILPVAGRTVSVTGRIQVVNLVNPYKKFNLQAGGLLSRHLLGRLVEEPHLEIVLRQEADEQTGLSDQYTFLVPESLVRSARLSEGSRATAGLIGHRVMQRTIWLAESIERRW
jgi:hypothetical protein